METTKNTVHSTIGETLIANPTYDVVFKYLMEDNDIAKLMVSSIIGEEVISLDPRPHEYTIEKIKVGEDSFLTIYRLDFSAKIKIDDGYKLVLIEMQKATVATDIMRFRGYLGRQYMDFSNMEIDDGDTIRPLQIYAIYFLGNELGICDTPVLRIFPNVVDVATETVIEAKNKFIESLNHKCWIVQISCLKQRRRNELEQLLSVFDQSNRSSDIHILNVREEDFPKKFRSVIRRLKMAASSPDVKKEMAEEDRHLLYLRDAIREGQYEVRKELEIIIAQTTHDLAQERKKNEELMKKLAKLEKPQTSNPKP
jgi:hypothetical protein